MNKLRNEIMMMKIQINSSYGMSGIQADLHCNYQDLSKYDTLYDEMLKKKQKFFKIQSRVSKIKKIYG